MVRALLLGIVIGAVVTFIPDPFALPALFLLSLLAATRIVSWNLNALNTQKFNVILMLAGEIGVLVLSGRVKIF